MATTRLVTASIAIACVVLAQEADAARKNREASGRQLYQSDCVSCHGPAGSQSNGTDLTTLARLNGTFPAYQVKNTLRWPGDADHWKILEVWNIQGGRARAEMKGHEILLYLETIQQQPAVIRIGDVCHRCRRIVEEPRLGVALVDGNAIDKFLKPSCLAIYLSNHDDDRAAVVTDYKTGEMLPAIDARFVPVIDGRSPAEHDFLAFRKYWSARKRAKQEGTQLMTWDEVLQQASP